MQQNRAVFFVIIGVAVLVVIGMIVGTFYMFGSVGEVSPLQSEVSIEVAAAPTIYPWVEDAAIAFNQSHPKVQVSVIETTDLIPEARFRSTNAQSPPPAAWIADASFILALGQNKGLSFQDAQSVAGSPLAWGAYTDKLEQFNQTYGELNWDSLHAKATSSEGLRLVLNSPQNSAEGIAALISATAFSEDSQSLSGRSVTSANSWLTETLGDGNAYAKPTPAQSFASVQGRTLGDVGLLSMASWREAKLDENANFTLLPAEPEVILDIPFAIWAGSQSTPEKQEAAAEFRDFLLSQNQQTVLSDYGLDPAVDQTGVQADGETADRLQSWAARVLR